MDEDTIEEQALEDMMETVPDNMALEIGDDTVVTSAAPPAEDDDSPWPERGHSMRGAVYFASGSTRVA
jgi:hypothetical protein